jgi:hypothetical protein
MNAETRSCQNCKTDFTIDSEDFDFYKKIDVPAPTFCPECRLLRRLAFRNERALYKRKSDLSGKDIFSGYSADIPFPVYDHEEWVSDDWDPLDYGRDYDFSRPFFEQFFELSQSVPRPSRSILNLVDSDYSNNATGLKNCYLTFAANYCEDTLFGVVVNQTKSCLDCSYAVSCELCYDSIFIERCSNTFYSVGCNDCLNVYFSKNCHGCSDCFGCVNLRNKQYYIWNKPYSKEEYEEKIKSFQLSKRSAVEKLKQEAEEFWLKYPVKYTEFLKSNNFSGTYIFNSQNVHNSHFVRGGRSVKNCQMLSVPTVEDCQDYTAWGANASLIYESAICGQDINNLKFCVQCFPSNHDLEYSIWCQNSSNLFGCVGLRNKQYCIFNKQFTKEEYFELREKIIEHMNDMLYADKQGNVYKYGEFFPAEQAMLPFNKSIAIEEFPLSREEALSRGWVWEDEPDNAHTITKQATELADDINDVTEEVLKEVIACKETGKAFRIVTQEFELYKRLGIPLPHFHAETRYMHRLKHRLPMKLHKRTTADGVEVMTAYAPDRPEIILSEKGYQDEVM